MMNRNVVTILTALLLVPACGIEERDFGDITGVEEIAQPLTALATAPTFSGSTLTIVMADDELAIVSKHAVTGAILVNDVATYDAASKLVTATLVKNITITGSSGINEVILDFANGTFAGGTATAAGIAIAFAGGADVFKVRGAATAADYFKITGTMLDADFYTSSDANKDVTIDSTGDTIAYTFSLGGGGDTFEGFIMSGTPAVEAPFAADLVVYGGAGDDKLTGGDGDDTLNGDKGADTLNGGSAADDGDVYVCGTEIDTVTYAARTAAVTITVGAGTDDGESGETDDVQASCEIVRGGSGADTFTGNTGDQTFYGGAGNDTFLMGLLATTGAGGDTVYGEAGIDTVSYAARLAGVTVTMAGNTANDGDTTTSELDNIRDDVENLICPTAAVANSVTGNTLDNTFTGGAGVDTFDGAAGDDTFIMGATAGIGAGADVMTGGAGVDTVSFASFGAVINVVMDGTASTTMAKVINSDIENLTCPTASACTATGNAGNNRMVGSSDDDTLTAGDGDDFVETNGGDDTIACGDGSDILVGSFGTGSQTGCEL